MNVNVYKTNGNVKILCEGSQEKQSQYAGLRPEILNPKQFCRYVLKKQSQLSKGQIYVISFLERVYGNYLPCGLRENKPNLKFTLSAVERANLEQVGDVVDSGFPLVRQRFDCGYHDDTILDDVTEPVVTAGNRDQQEP